MSVEGITETLTPNESAAITSRKRDHLFLSSTECCNLDLLSGTSTLLSYLPLEIVVTFLATLDSRSLQSLACTSREMNDLADSDLIWKSLCYRSVPYLARNLSAPGPWKACYFDYKHNIDPMITWKNYLWQKYRSVRWEGTVLAVSKSKLLWGPLTIHVKMDSICTATRDNNVLLHLSRTCSDQQEAQAVAIGDRVEFIGRPTQFSVSKLCACLAESSSLLLHSLSSPSGLEVAVNEIKILERTKRLWDLLPINAVPALLLLFLLPLFWLLTPIRDFSAGLLALILPFYGPIAHVLRFPSAAFSALQLLLSNFVLNTVLLIWQWHWITSAFAPSVFSCLWLMLVLSALRAFPAKHTKLIRIGGMLAAFTELLLVSGFYSHPDFYLYVFHLSSLALSTVFLLLSSTKRGFYNLFWWFCWGSILSLILYFTDLMPQFLVSTWFLVNFVSL